MRVKVRYFGVIRARLSRREEEIEIKEGATLSDLLDKLIGMYGESLKELFEIGKGEILDPSFIVTINGALARRGMETRLKGGDSIALMNIICGG